MATKNHPGEFDCYAKAEPDEPIFVLLARDRHAPALVWLWAAIREWDGEDPAVVAEARASVIEMITWADDHRPARPTPGFGKLAAAGLANVCRAMTSLTGTLRRAREEGNIDAAEGLAVMMLAGVEIDPDPK